MREFPFGETSRHPDGSRSPWRHEKCVYNLVMPTWIEAVPIKKILLIADLPQQGAHLVFPMEILDE
jgi:hypothetical protein